MSNFDGDPDEVFTPSPDTNVPLNALVCAQPTVTSILVNIGVAPALGEDYFRSWEVRMVERFLLTIALNTNRSAMEYVHRIIDKNAAERFPAFDTAAVLGGQDAVQALADEWYKADEKAATNAGWAKWGF